MFLFNKKTRNTIKFVWGILASMVVLSMIITYSGFTALPNAQQGSTEQQIEIPPEVRAQLEAQKNGGTIPTGDDNSPEKQQIMKAIEEGRLDINPSDGEAPVPQENTSSQTPPPQELKLEI